MAKDRSSDNTAISISLSKKALAQIDARARARGLSRSAYLQLMALPEETPPAPASASPAPAVATALELTKPIGLTAEVYDFLLIAIPALEEYEELKKNNQPMPEDSEEIPSGTTNEKLWRFFILERDEILRHKYFRSQELGYDIGLNRAVMEWLMMHRTLWAKANPPATA